MHHDFLDKYSDLESPVHRMNVKVKVLFFFSLIIICVSTPPANFTSFLLYGIILLILLAVSKVPLSHVLKKSLVIIPFVLMISLFIPFTGSKDISGGISLGIGDITIGRDRLLLFWNILIKSYTAVTALIILNSTTPFNQLINGLRGLKFPDIFINIMSFFYRYIFVIIDEAERMKRALTSRNFRPRSLFQVKVIGDLLGVLFLRSYERGERVYLSMCARGYSGRFNSSAVEPVRFTDIIFGCAAVSALLIIRFGFII